MNETSKTERKKEIDLNQFEQQQQMRKNIYMKMKLPIAKKNKMDSSKGFKCKNVEFQVFK